MGGTLLSVMGVAMALVVAEPALAARDDRAGEGHRTHGDRNRGGNVVAAPEFDVAATGTIAVIVAGGGVLLARRRRR